MTTTDITAIITKFYSVIGALTPVAMPTTRPFTKSTAPNGPFRRWAMQAGGLTLFRMFEVRRVGKQITLGVTDPTAELVRQNLEVLVAYPVLPKMFGHVDMTDFEAVIYSDIAQIQDAINSVGNLANAGHQVSSAQIEEPDRGDDRIWFQMLTVETTFYTPRTA